MTTSREFLELALSGEKITPAHIDALLTEQVKEDGYLDYKSGDILNKKTEKEAQRTIRQYMSGFANSEGGVLLVGVEEVDGRPTEVTGCDARQLKGDLAGWAARCVTPIGAYFSPSPRFEVVSHLKGEVLTCAVGRSYNLVPVVEGEKLVHYFRLGDQMLAAPDYLVTDLRLGRRVRPNLEVSDWQLDGIKSQSLGQGSYRDGALLMFTLQLEMANAGLVWAEQSRWGLVFRNIDPNAQPLPSNHYLGTFVEFASAEGGEAAQRIWTLGKDVHLTGNLSIDKPFTRAWANPIHVTVPFFYDEFICYQWKAAAYLVAKDAPPIWYQVALTIDAEFREHVPDSRLPAGGLPRGWSGLSLGRLTSERPLVGWIPLAETNQSE